MTASIPTPRDLGYRDLSVGDYERVQAWPEMAVLSGPRWRQYGASLSPDQFVAHLWAGVVCQYVIGEPRPIGLFSLYGADLRSGFAYISIFCSDDRSISIVADSWSQLLEYCFAQWPLRKIYSEVIARNKPRFQAATCGSFCVEAVLQQHVRCLDGYDDLLVMSVRRPVE